MTDEPAEAPIVFKRTWSDYEDLFTDGRRKADVRYWHMTARPDRSLRKNEEFAEIRAVPWKLNLAIEMAWFVRSDDLSSDIWPYKRFHDRLIAGGTPLPAGMSIARAVAIVSSDLERLTLPKTPRAKAWERGTWFERNISRPMARRIGATSLGAPSLSVDDTGQDSELHESSDYSTGTFRSVPQIDWLTGRTRDLDLETMAVPHLDVSRAPHVLDQRLTAARRQMSLYREEASTEASGDERLQRAIQLLERHALALTIAAHFAKTVASQVSTLDEFRAWLMNIDGSRRDKGESQSTSEFWLNSPLARSALDFLAPASQHFAEIIEESAHQYAYALGLVHDARQVVVDSTS